MHGAHGPLLWFGLRHPKRSNDVILSYLDFVINDGVWESAYACAQKARAGRVTVPGSDLLIAACARFHIAGLEYADSDSTGYWGFER